MPEYTKDEHGRLVETVQVEPKVFRYTKCELKETLDRINAELVALQAKRVKFQEMYDAAVSLGCVHNLMS